MSKLEELVPPVGNILSEDVTEQWRTLPAGGQYIISDKGRIISLSYKKSLKPSFIKTVINRNGYYQFAAYIDGKYKSLTVHRQVALAFCEIKEDYKQVNHINGIKTDNRACNLEFVTPSENMKHAYRTGLKTNIPSEQARLSAHKMAAMKFRKEVMCIETGEIFVSAKEAAKKLNLTTNCISRVCTGVRKHTKGLHFKYTGR
jgi:hypothetical protein